MILNLEKFTTQIKKLILIKENGSVTNHKIVAYPQSLKQFSFKMLLEEHKQYNQEKVQGRYKMVMQKVWLLVKNLPKLITGLI